MSTATLSCGPALVKCHEQKIQLCHSELKHNLEKYLRRREGRHENEVSPSQRAIARRALECLSLIESAFERVGIFGGGQ
jgi:hypothetical protein